MDHDREFPDFDRPLRGHINLGFTKPRGHAVASPDNADLG